MRQFRCGHLETGVASVSGENRAAHRNKQPLGTNDPGSRREIRLMTNGMTSGTVKWFNPTKGYGFIAPETGGKDIFVHISAVQKAGLRNLNEGQRVGFEVEQQQNGRTAAVNLQRSE
jgi:cold shock protein